MVSGVCLWLGQEPVDGSGSEVGDVGFASGGGGELARVGKGGSDFVDLVVAQAEESSSPVARPGDGAQRT